VSEPAAVETVEEWGSTVAADAVCDDIIELVTKPIAAPIDIHPYEQPVEATASPLEFAFHLLNGVRGRTVVDLGCGTGFNSVLLAKLGAQVVAIDKSESNIQATEQRARSYGVTDRLTLIQSHESHLPAQDNFADRVFCNAILQYTDPISIARQIRRVLKPGGRAVFHASGGSGLFRRWCGIGMTTERARTLSRAVGIPDPLREFWLVTSLLRKTGVACSSSLGRASQRFDASVFQRLPFMRVFASTLVWGAHKEK
jgi:SAM-dependent methyltransferase